MLIFGHVLHESRGTWKPNIDGYSVGNLGFSRMAELMIKDDKMGATMAFCSQCPVGTTESVKQDNKHEK